MNFMLRQSVSASHRAALRWSALLRGSACAILLSLASAQAQAPLDVRVALVIGNSAYLLAPLVNPANDARAMSEALKAKGFSVHEARDADRAAMQAAILKMGAALKGRQGVGLLYYAGHAIQLDWHNYLVPVDARMSVAADVPAQTIDVQTVLDAFKAAGSRLNIVVLDACRDNPFGAAASGKGLAQIDAPPGTLLAYATAPGNVADDNPGGSNGLYTEYLLQELKSPGARIEDVFKRVRLQVRRKSEGRQVPWESTSLEDDFYFDPQTQRVQRDSWEKSVAAEKSDWDRIKESSRPDDFFAYLQKYPSGSLAEQAQFRLDQLQKARIQVQPGPDGIRPLPSGTQRFAVGDVFRYRSIDGFTQNATERVLRVTSLDGDRVVFNKEGGPVFDQMGGVLRNRFGTKDPAHLVVPADIAIGKRWRSAFTNTRRDSAPSNNFWEHRVVALEDVVVPAGTFKAYRIERQGEARPTSGAGMTFLTATDWVDPRTMLVVRTDIKYRQPGRGAGTVTEYFSDQLVSFERQAR
jgi:uncharacterized caspase-like protein